MEFLWMKTKVTKLFLWKSYNWLQLVAASSRPCELAYGLSSWRCVWFPSKCVKKKIHVKWFWFYHILVVILRAVEFQELLLLFFFLGGGFQWRVLRKFFKLMEFEINLMHFSFWYSKQHHYDHNLRLRVVSLTLTPAAGLTL